MDKNVKEANVNILKVLIVVSASKRFLHKLIPLIQRFYPKASLTLLIEKARMREKIESEFKNLSKNAIVYDTIENRQHPLKFAKFLRSERWDVAVALFTGENKWNRPLKLVPFLCGAKHILVYNENATTFYWNLQNLRKVLRYIRRRISSFQTWRPLLDPILKSIGFIIIVLKALRISIGIFAYRLFTHKTWVKNEQNRLLHKALLKPKRDLYLQTPLELDR